MNCILVTGGAGFIGSHLVDHLLASGRRVKVYDDFSSGRPEFLGEAQKNSHFEFIQGDLLDEASLEQAMKGVDFVFHMAAHADVRFGTQHPKKDLEQNTIATSNVLEAMRKKGVKKIAFPSTGSVYGEPEIFPTPEHAPFPVQTSFYGASKLACEGLLQAYADGFGFQVWIFRFVSILGERYTHGHVRDFYEKLLQNPKELEVLGDGRQKKSYLYVTDCIEAMLFAVRQAREKINIFNLGTDEYAEVNDSVKWMTERLKLNPRLHYSGGARGWPGDSPFIFLNCSKIRSLGWKPKLTIKEAFLRTLEYLIQNRNVILRPKAEESRDPSLRSG